ncbi:MAG TPA: glycosyltransferase [Gemmatimonadales bacterium]|nr:glycosyltransferase [Gemmatimonadales bacterium]
MTQHATKPTFLDPSGRRKARLKAGIITFGILSTLIVLVVFTGMLVSPVLPDLPLTQTAADSLGRVPRTARRAVRRTISIRAERERLASRQRLFQQLMKERRPLRRSLRYSEIPLGRRLRADSALAAHRGAYDPTVVGFYVNWDDNSLASLRKNIDRLDWVVAEWGLVRARGDSTPLLFQVDRRVLALAALAKQPPIILLMLTNATATGFDAGAVRRLIRTERARRATIKEIVDTVTHYRLGGVTIDFEDLPPSMHPLLLRFLRELKPALEKEKLLLTQAVPGDDPTWPVEDYARINDRVFLMLYDEHDPSDDPGAVASQAWFDHHLARLLDRVPAGKALVGIGEYGYLWADTSESATELTFQDVMQLARDHAIHPAMDRDALNPTFHWDDPDSTSNIVWYLDGATAWNQIRAAERAGVAGIGIWRLGSEDPSLWSVLGRGGLTATPTPLDSMFIDYDVNFIGTGEILRMVSEPTPGRRWIRTDPATGAIVDERVDSIPSTYVIRRYGRKKHEVALTFDDGPDPVFTPMILDTLRSRGVHATFFVIGENVELHPALVRRELHEGDEIGSHTFTHPNLALVGKQTTRFELNATERLLEAILDRRTALWRPPYFGDAEPTTADELVPVSIAQGLGYITVGLHIDPSDWATPGTDSIISRTLAQLDRGNVILLHDGGGDRRETVAALGPLIDSIRARGYTITTVTALAGVSTAEAMAALPPRSAFARFVTLTSYSVIGWIELALHAVFLVAMVLGATRLLVILLLAARQRYSRRHARKPAVTGYRPTVSVVVPAYNEEAVVTRTVRSLLDQEYPGLEIVVVDDGSPDRTTEVLTEAFGAHPQVRLLRKANGGKASALNVGVAEAHGEVIVALDADTLFPPGTIAELVAPLADPKVGAVAGNAKVGNRINLVTRWQAIEYITSQNIDRRAFSLLNCITVVPGAVGAWRKELILQAGGFSGQTLAEDQDLTMAILRKGYHVAYADKAVGLTEAPDTIRLLFRQRFRWSYGTLQCAWKHRGALLRPRYGLFGFVGLPNVWIFQLLFPFLSPIADLLFLWSLVTVYIMEVMHGPEFAMQTLEQVVLFYTAFLAIDWLAAVIALWMEPDEERWLSSLVLLQRFVYRQVMYMVVVKAVMTAIRGSGLGWGKQERKGTVALRTP